MPPIWSAFSIRSLWHTTLGLFQLFRLAALSRFRFSGAYWQWRTHTAFGRGWPATRTETVRSVLEYARWVGLMRRGSR